MGRIALQTSPSHNLHKTSVQCSYRSRARDLCKKGFGRWYFEFEQLANLALERSQLTIAGDFSPLSF
jgi:hypothetical protein